MNSCLYEGSVRHRRREGLHDEFRHPLFMVYVDLDELPRCFESSRLFSARGPALAWFRRADHLGDPAVALRTAVVELVRERVGVNVDGPVRLLTNLRYFGHCFNPVSFYYCFDRAGGHVVATVAHVTNTPWGEQHSYVMAVEREADHGSAALVRASSEKTLHVSPLMSMQHTYDWRMTVPSERLAVHIQSLTSAGESCFDATLSLRRRPLNAHEMRRVLARYPLLTMRIVARIYGHALALRLRGASWYPHPRRGTVPT